MKAKISIVIPCYNNGNLLSKMIDCILEQTYIHWELIVVDDVSSDNTEEIVKEHALKDTRIRLLVRNRLPKGAQTCRNIGLANAIGEFVVFFDADDLISNTCLEKRIEFMQNNPLIDYASFPAQSFNNNKHLPVFSENVKCFGVGNENTNILSDLLKADYSAIGWTNIYRKNSLFNLFWDEKVKVYQDFDFAISEVLAGLKHKFSNSKEFDYFYRVGNGDTISSNYVSQEKCDSTIYLFSKTLHSLKHRSDYNKRKREFYQFIVLHFERLILNGEKQKVNDYLAFVKRFYSLFYFILYFISNITLFVKNKSIRKLTLYLLTLIFFFRKGSFLAFGSALKHWK
jgi:glycosyltransferase involved in cell wall biosynthesis